MDNPLYPATIIVGGSETTYTANKVLGVRIHADQSFDLEYTFVKADGTTAHSIDGSTSALRVSSYKNVDFPSALLVSGVPSASTGGTVDRITFTVPADAIPEDLAKFPLKTPGNSVFYAVITDGAGKKIEVVAQVNVFDTDYALTGEANPSAQTIVPIKNDLGTVESSNLTTPPTPTLNAAYIVGVGATGLWSGQDNDLAIGTGSAWVFLTPTDGNFVFDKNDGIQIVFDGTSWVNVSGAPFSDADALIKNDADNTKLIKISAASIATATTRTLTMPDQDIDLTPDTGSFIKNIVSDPSPELGGFLDAKDFRISNLLGLGFKATTVLDIATGAVTQTQLIHNIGTQSAAATDDFDSIVPATGQTEILITMNVSGEVPTIKHASGTNTFLLPADTDIEMVMNTFYHFHHDGTNWKLVGSAASGGGGGGNFPSSTIHADITGAYTVLIGDENTTIPVGSATTADFDITYDVSLWTTAGSQLTITNKSAFIARLVVSNTGTMKIAGGIDKFVNANESLTVMADTSTQVWPGANA